MGNSGNLWRVLEREVHGRFDGFTVIDIHRQIFVINECANE